MLTLLIALSQDDTSEYVPLEDGMHFLEAGSVKNTGGGQLDLAFLGDYATWNEWTYKSTRHVRGPCSQKLSGTTLEAKAFTFSWGTTQTAEGKIASGVGGQGSPSASAEISASVAQMLGISIAATESFSLKYECERREGVRPIALIEFEVTEYSGIYTDWHWFSGTRYEFHAHFRRILEYDCEYEKCGESQEQEE